MNFSAIIKKIDFVIQHTVHTHKHKGKERTIWLVHTIEFHDGFIHNCLLYEGLWFFKRKEKELEKNHSEKVF